MMLETIHIHVQYKCSLYDRISKNLYTPHRNSTLQGTLLVTLLNPQVNPTSSQLNFIRRALFAEIRSAASVSFANPVQRYGKSMTK